MAEGALEAGRKDIARLLREISTVQYRAEPAQEPAPATARIQNAAYTFCSSPKSNAAVGNPTAAFPL